MKIANCCMCDIKPVVELTGDGARVYCPQCGMSTAISVIQEWAVKEWNSLVRTTRTNVQKMVDRSTPKIIKKRLEIAEEIIARDNAREAKEKALEKVKEKAVADVNKASEKMTRRRTKKEGLIDGN